MLYEPLFKMFKPLLAIGLVMGITIACSGDDKPPLPGKRIAVLIGNNEVEPDPSLVNEPVMLPAPHANNGWPQAGGFVDHANYHLALGESPKKIWSVSIGSISPKQGHFIQPVVADGKVFAMDNDYVISAFDGQTGKRLWRTAIDVPSDDDDVVGGGIAFDNGRIYVTTGFAMSYAFNANDGKQLWETKIDGPMRTAPSVDQNRMIITTIDNQSRGINTDDGALIWRHFGIAEIAGLRGGASPAISDNITIIPYSSGEIFALRANNGRELWSESLASLQPLNALANLADIRAMPVIDRGIVYVVGHAGRMMAIDLSTGVRAWERSIGGTEMPWAAGDYIFVVSSDAILIALTRRGGRIKWSTYLPEFEDMESREDKIIWRGPVLAGDRLLLANNLGSVLSVSPYDGKIMGEIKFSNSISTMPIIADNILFILEGNGTLTALK